MMPVATRARSVCWGLGVALSGLAVPGIAFGQTSPAADAVPPAAVAAPASPPAAVSAQPVPPPAPPYAPPPPGYPGYPPPWPGYTYPPAPSYAAARLAMLDAQIRDLQIRREEITLALPIVLLVGGGVLGILGLGMVVANVCPKDQYGAPRDPGCVENRSSLDQGAVLIIAGGVGIAFGATSLIIRAAKRSHIARQIDARTREADALRPLVAPRWGVSPLRNGGGVLLMAFDF